MRLPELLSTPNAAVTRLLAVILAATAMPAHAQSSSDSDTVTYVMPARSSLYLIAQRYFEQPGDYVTVQKLNHIRDPRRIPVGARLLIPRRLLRTEPLNARVQALRGTVTISDSTAQTITPTIGTLLGAGTVIETGKDGFAGLGLPNGSQISMPTGTRIRVRTLGRIMLTDQLDFDIQVERGKIDTRAAPMPPAKGRFKIRTPRAVAAIRGTVVRVGFGEETGGSQAELIEGHVSFGAGSGGTDLAAGFGATMAASGEVFSERLLPAPDIAAPGAPLTGPVARVRLNPVAGSQAYHVQVGSDSSFTDLVAEATDSGPDITLPAFADGRWFVRVSAISSSGLEGLPQSYSLRRLSNDLKASTTQDEAGLRFKWSDGGGSISPIYRFQIAQGAQDAVPFIDEPGLTKAELTLSGLGDGVYFWRVGMSQTVDGETIETWLPFDKLTVGGASR